MEKIENQGVKVAGSDALPEAWYPVTGYQAQRPELFSNWRSTIHSVRKLWIVNGVLALPTGYWSCFLAYALYHRERLLWCETTILVHFVAPASILLLLLLSFKSRPILRAKLALSATVAMFVLFLADASLPKRGSSVEPARVEAALDRGLPYDTRSTLEVILALRAQGKRAVPVVSPATFTYKGVAKGSRSLLSRLMVAR